jgi:hypothetical protein
MFEFQNTTLTTTAINLEMGAAGLQQHMSEDQSIIEMPNVGAGTAATPEG